MLTERIHIPILLNHDQKRVIGRVESLPSGKLRVRLIDGFRLPKAQLFDIFGNCGVLIEEMEGDFDGVCYVRQFIIFEFSVDGETL